LAEQQALWQTLGGDWIVTPGEQASATRGLDEALPQMHCTVNTLSRLLWGVSRASSLAISDGLTAPVALLQALDGVFTANPNPGWEF
jgi:hypothetical protein